MRNIINPLCDMPWDIYLDYLADQGFDELREIDVNSLVSGNWNNWWLSYENNSYHNVEFIENEGLIISIDICDGISGHQSGQGDQIHNYEISIINFYEYGNGAILSEAEIYLNRIIAGCGIW